MFKRKIFIALIISAFASFSIQAKSNKQILAKNYNSVGRVYSGQQPELELIKKSPTTRTFVNDIVYEEITLKNGIILEESHAKDVVSFVDRFYGHETSTGIWTNNVKATSLDQAVQEGNLVEAIIFLKKTPDAKKRIELLEKYANQGHVICMFELCKEIAEQENQDKTVMHTKIAVWFTRAMIRLIQDIACHHDTSVQAAFDALITTYMFLLKDQVVLEQKDLLASVEESFDWVTKLKTLPSPEWVGYHGLAVFNEGLQLIVEKDWEKQRKEVIKKAQEAFYEVKREKNEAL